MRVEPLRPDHFEGLRLQDPQAYLQADLDADLAAALLELGPGFAGIEGDRVVAAAGVMRPHEHWVNPMAWALLTAGMACTRTFARRVRAFLEASAEPVIDTTIDPRWPAHERWAGWLGFERQGRFPLPRPDGAMVDLWQRRRRGH